jgi:small subunit ribosomal protein S4
MGDPRKITNKFSKPMHPWQKARLDAEKPIMKIYGLVNKKELWKMTSKLKKYKDTAKQLVAKKGKQAELERYQLVNKLKSYNLIQTESLDDLLGLKVEQLLDRRLQTLVHKKGLAKTIKQARQMITHRHIMINGKKITAPGYLVRGSEEGTLQFYSGSGFNNPDHPERIQTEHAPAPAATKKKEDAPKDKEAKTEESKEKAEAKQ